MYRSPAKTAQVLRAAVLIAPAFVSLSAFAVNTSRFTPFDCVSEDGQLVGCASLPTEARESTPVESSMTAPRVATPVPGREMNKISLLTRTELSGGAVAPPRRARSVNDVGPVRGRLNSAMLAAFRNEAQIRRIELFLKSGVASSGDLRVVEAGRVQK